MIHKFRRRLHGLKDVLIKLMMGQKRKLIVKTKNIKKTIERLFSMSPAKGEIGTEIYYEGAAACLHITIWYFVPEIYDGEK